MAGTIRGSRAIPLAYIVAAFVLVLVAAGLRLVFAQEIKYGGDANASKRMTLLLKDLRSQVHAARRGTLSAAREISGD